MLAWVWLPETVHRAHAGGGAPWHALRESGRPPAACGCCLRVDFVYWMSFAVYQTTFALFGARRFGFDAAHTGYLLSAFGFLGVIVQGGLVGPIVRALGDRRTLAIGLLFAAVGWGGSALTYSLPVFVAMLVPGGVRHRAVQRDADRARQQRGGAARAGPRPGRGRCAREPGPDARSGLGKRRPAEDSARAAAYGAAAGLLVIAAGMAGRYKRAGPRTRERLKSAPLGDPSPNCGELSFEASHQFLHLLDHRADGVGLAQVDARLLQLLHRIVVAARPQQRRGSVPAPRRARPRVPSMISFASRAADAKQVAYW